MLYVYTAKNLRYNNYGVRWWTIFGDELSECRCDVELSVRCFRLRSSKIDVSTFEDRCVDFRRSTIDVSTFEDGWLMYRPSKIDGRCVDLQDRWSMWNYVATLAQNIDGIVVCGLRRGFALQCFHYTWKLFSINRKKGKATNPNNSFFSEKKKELLGWDSNPRHTAC